MPKVIVCMKRKPGVSREERARAARRLAEARFIDFSRSRTFFVNERVVIG